MTTVLPNDISTPVPAPSLSSPLISQSASGTVQNVVSSALSGPPLLVETSKSPIKGADQGPILIGLTLGAAVLVTVGLFICLLICRRRRRRRQQTETISDTRSLISTDSRSEKVSTLHGNHHDIENPPPAHLGKLKSGPVFPRLRTLQLVSMPSLLKSAIKSPNPAEKPHAETMSTNTRSYAIQPSIPFSNNLFHHNISRNQESSNQRITSTSTLPEGFESFIYSLQSPQSAELAAKQPSYTSFGSTIKFARDSMGWALRRGSVASVATVFDESQHKRASVGEEGDKIGDLLKSPPLSPAELTKKRASRAPLSASYKGARYMAIPEVPEEMSYSLTPLAPPPAHMKARAVSPSGSRLHRSDSSSSAASRESSASSQVVRKNPEIRLIPPSASISGDMAQSSMPASRNILQSAVLHGKISQEEVESVTGLPLKLSS